jgi:hypothetical protein
MFSWMYMEWLFYEAKPYLFLLAATGTLLSADSKTLVLYFSCLTLIVCSLTILRWRFIYRYQHRGKS